MIFDIVANPIIPEIKADNLIFEINTNPLITDIKIDNLIFEFDNFFIPDFATNGFAIKAGLKEGELWRDPDNKIKIVMVDRRGLILNLSSAFSLFRRLF